VQATKLATFTSTTTSFVDITGLSVTITPSSATSKILLISFVNISNTETSNVNRGGTYIRITGGNAENFVGDAASLRRQAAYGIMMSNQETSNRHMTQYSGTIVFLDAPASAAAVTYKTQMLCTRTTATLNRSGADLDTTHDGRTASSLVAIEVAA
jgi:aspartate 1-decarboxylase